MATSLAFIGLVVGGFGFLLFIIGLIAPKNSICDNGLYAFAWCILLLGGGYLSFTSHGDMEYTNPPIQTLTPAIGPGHGWSCVPANNSAVQGEIVCRPVTLEAGS